MACDHSFPPVGPRTADAFARYGVSRGLPVTVAPETVARQLVRECHARLSRRPMPPAAGADRHDFTIQIEPWPNQRHRH